MSDSTPTSNTFLGEANVIEDDALHKALDVQQRLATLADLDEGWLDGEGARISGETIDWVGLVLGEAEREGLRRPYLYPTPDGLVQAEWSFPGAEVSVLFDRATSTASCVGVHTRTGAHTERDLDLRSPEGIRALVAVVSSFHPQA